MSSNKCQTQARYRVGVTIILSLATAQVAWADPITLKCVTEKVQTPQRGVEPLNVTQWWVLDPNAGTVKMMDSSDVEPLTITTTRYQWSDGGRGTYRIDRLTAAYSYGFFATGAEYMSVDGKCTIVKDLKPAF